MPPLLTIHQVDPWLQFNPHIVTGYRPRMSVRAALRSFFDWHNESLNVWTHAAAALFVLYLIIFPPTMNSSTGAVTTATLSGYITTLNNNNNNNKAGSNIMGVSTTTTPTTTIPPSFTQYEGRLLGGGGGTNGNSDNSEYYFFSMSSTTTFRMTCLIFLSIFICSVLYHLLMPCTTSEVSYRRLLNCDAFGVVISMTGTSWSFLYRGNACSPPLTSHVCSVALILSSVFIIFNILFNPSCGAVGRFKAIGIHCALRLLFLLWIELPKAQLHGYHQALQYHMMSYVFITAGGVVNAVRFPEKYLRRYLTSSSTSKLWRRVGSCLVAGEDIDYMWNSHSLWHYCIILSSTVTLLGCYYDVEEFELVRC